MTLHKEHRTPRTFNCLRQIDTPNKRCFRITQNSVRIQKQNQTDGKHNLILLNARWFQKYMYKNKFVCKCIKLTTFSVHQHMKAILVSTKLLKIISIKPMFSFKFQTIISHHIFICTHKL